MLKSFEENDRSRPILLKNSQPSSQTMFSGVLHSCPYLRSSILERSERSIFQLTWLQRTLPSFSTELAISRQSWKFPNSGRSRFTGYRGCQPNEPVKSISMIYTTPAVQELLVRVHGGVVIAQFASHQLKAFAKFMMKFRFVISDHIQPAALQRSVRAESSHEHVSAGLD